MFGHLKLDQERKSRGQGHEHVCPKVQQPATMIRLQVRGKMYKALVGDDDGVLVRRAQQFELQERELFVRDIRDVIARKHGRAFGSAAWMRGVPCVQSGLGRGCKRGVSVVWYRAIQAL